MQVRVFIPRSTNMMRGGGGGAITVASDVRPTVRLSAFHFWMDFKMADYQPYLCHNMPDDI